ncbi:MAG: DUF5009 domain-containing protein [Planctomycetes bacterium]|nr:DUF5009 domain-containing protein [Planctomycetota bacterium]
MADNQPQPLKTPRVASIDALRGFDMFWIMGGGTVVFSLCNLINHPITETIKDQLKHVVWEGFRFEDLIFPLFLFIVGAVLPFSLQRRLDQGFGKFRITFQIFRRAVILVLIGLIMNGLLRLEFDDFRYAGVLQRIGVCYFFGALIVLYFKTPVRVVFFAAILLLYWAALMFIPVPNAGGEGVAAAGVITMQGCLTSYVDQLLLPGKLWYGFGDNEGILSTFPAVCTVLLGVFAGSWLKCSRGKAVKLFGLILAGAACVGLGYLWGMPLPWGMQLPRGIHFPVIKIIWTSSFVLFAGGWSLLLLAFFYLWIDIFHLKKTMFFFMIIGMNPIFIFFVPRFIKFDQIADYFFGGVLPLAGDYQIFLTVLSVFAVKWLALYFLYRRRIFFKI